MLLFCWAFFGVADSISSMQKNSPQQENSHDNHSHDDHSNHSHAHNDQASKSIYALPFFLILAFAFLELFGGFWTQSLALLSDAWHMFSDVFALGLAWFASHISTKPGTHKHANGQSHAEIGAAAVNALLMLIVVAYIMVEAWHRLDNPQPVTGGYVMLIASAGLIVNLIVAKMLHSGGGDGHDHAHDHNKRAAYLHVMGDLLGSLAALVAGAVIYYTGWLKIDPLLSIFISLMILVVTLNLIKDVWRAYKNG
jgi:cobalt-zinc-cadmium efflux system protein